MKPYKRFTYKKRLQLEALYNTRTPVRVIAEALGYSKAAIYVEIKKGLYDHRNSDWTYTRKYSADRAEQSARFNRTQGPTLKIAKDREFVRVVEKMLLKEKLSPEAALIEIRKRNIPVTRVCTTTLYSYVKKGLFLHVTAKQLPYRGNRRKKTTEKRPQKSPRYGTSIELRPAEIATRQSFGHWELDSVIGKRAKGETLLVLTERKTRYELIFRAKDKTVNSTRIMLDRLERKLGRDFRRVFRSVTCDNGAEFASPSILEKSRNSNRKRTTFYYCHPYSSYERGSNENQNRIIRRFIPKGVPISHFSDLDLRRTQDYLNNIPRRILGLSTAAEAFQKELDALGIKKF